MPVIEPNGVALPTISREDQERCEELLQRWMVALISYDAAGMKSVMRFPHVRLAEDRVAIYQADDNPRLHRAGLMTVQTSLIPASMLLHSGDGPALAGPTPVPRRSLSCEAT